MQDIIDMLEDFYYDHQRGIIATIIVIVVMIIAYISFLVLYNPVKIKFEGEDYKIVATIPTKLEYKAVAYDKNTQDHPLTWEISAGTLDKTEGKEVVWELPKEAGSYTITAMSGETKIIRTVTIIENILVDTLTETEKQSLDDDMDGLTNEYEQTVIDTDSKNSDSDADTLLDGDELVLGLDPTLSDSKFDRVEDSQRELTYNFTDTNTNAVLEVKGKGNLTKTTIDSYETNSLMDLKEIISPVYYVYSEAYITSINVTLKYDKNIVQSRGLNEDSLCIYVLKEDTNEYIKLESTLNKDTSSITSQIKENSKIFIADSSTMINKISTELMFVIDNSGSMYSKEQIAESSENDVDFKRLSTANKMIDKLQGDYKFGAGKFTFDYTELAALTSDKEYVKSKIESIKTSTEKFTGTYIGEALSGGLKQFSVENPTGARRYLILLTDGKDTENVDGYDKDKTEKAIIEAKQKGVKVFTIGLGKEIDEEVLKNIATQTSGQYYYALNADILNSLFEIIASQINYSLVDSNGDHEDDSIVIADSGFITKRNGFSFDNIPLQSELNGTTYGMSLLSKLYYEGKLPKSFSSMSVKASDREEVVKAEGFDLSDLELAGSLYENQIDELEFLSDVPKDFRNGGVVNSVVKIKEEYRSILENSGFKIYNQKYTKSEAEFSEYEIFILDMESEEYKNNMNSQGEAYFKALTRLDILKYRDETIAFDEKPNEAMHYLKETLSNSNTCLLKLNDIYTVNAIRLTESNSDPNKFRIEIYDPNVSGIEKYIECTRHKIFTFETGNDEQKIAKESYIYEFIYNGKKVDVKISIPNIEANV